MKKAPLLILKWLFPGFFMLLGLFFYAAVHGHSFLGLIFCDISTGLSGWIKVFVMLVSAVCMALMGLLMKVTKWKWLNDYALPISMVLGMISAIPLTTLLGGI